LASGSLAIVSWYLIDLACFSLISALSRSPTMRCGSGCKDEAWKDEVAPEEGSPFRPLYDDSIKFNGQPIGWS